MTKADGSIAVTHAQVREVWHRHFADIEAAIDVTPDELLRESRRIRDKMFAAVDFDADAVPNIFELCASFLTAARNRSCGPDGIPDELFAMCCLQMVRLYAPLLQDVSPHRDRYFVGGWYRFRTFQGRRPSSCRC